jgi:hypothetical protein
MPTREEIAAVLAESRRLLEDKPKAPEQPAPVREVPEPSIPDALELWKKQADEADARRAEAKRELRREEGNLLEARSAVARIDTLEAHVAELQRTVAESGEMMEQLARGAETFSAAVNDVLGRMEKRLEELSTKLTELRAVDDLHRRGVIDMPSPLIRRVN